MVEAPEREGGLAPRGPVAARFPKGLWAAQNRDGKAPSLPTCSMRSRLAASGSGTNTRRGMRRMTASSRSMGRLVAASTSTRSPRRVRKPSQCWRGGGGGCVSVCGVPGLAAALLVTMRSGGTPQRGPQPCAVAATPGRPKPPKPPAHRHPLVLHLAQRLVLAGRLAALGQEGVDLVHKDDAGGQLVRQRKQRPAARPGGRGRGACLLPRNDSAP